MKKSSRAESEGKNRRRVRDGLDFAAPGRNTWNEILSQPAKWEETIRRAEEEGTLARFSEAFTAREPWLFVGCGSSYYLSQLAASLWMRQLQITCEAVPASELLFAPEETLRRSRARQVALISRSGETTEVLRAAQLLQGRGSIKTLGITCNTAGPLERLCTHMVTLDWTDEKSTVMTRSFTSILVLLQEMAARWSGDERLRYALGRLPERGQRWLETNADKILEFGAKRRFADLVFLGQGAHYWLAQEAALKITEMSSSYAQAYHTLEFRHGPRSIAGRGTLVTFLLSDASEREEMVLANELKQMGAATMVIVNRAKPALDGRSDLLIDLGLDDREDARFALTAIPAQLLGLSIGLRKGLNPDAPKNLSRAVVFGTDDGPLRRSRG